MLPEPSNTTAWMWSSLVPGCVWAAREDQAGAIGVADDVLDRLRPRAEAANEALCEKNRKAEELRRRQVGEEPEPWWR